MVDYTQEELIETPRAINSVIHKCEKTQEKFPEGNLPHTILRNPLKTMYKDDSANQLILNLDKLHSTELGINRIKKNLHLDVDDVVGWCKENIQSPDSIIARKGKNWYIITADCKITVNAGSYTIITAHRLTRLT